MDLRSADDSDLSDREKDRATKISRKVRKSAVWIRMVNLGLDKLS